jgi:dipeptidase E
MKLFLYSRDSENNPLDSQLHKTIENIDKPVMTIFMSDSDTFKAKYAYPIIDYFKKCGFSKVNVCLYPKNLEEQAVIAKEYVDIEFIAIDEAFKSTAIFLSGGNSYYFLNAIKKAKIFENIKEFALNGGLLVGLSAGSMLMTPDISNSNIPTYDPCPNEVGEVNFTALSLVDFYFFPHFDGNKQYLEEVKAFAKAKRKTCYLCNDTSGIYVEDSKLTIFGDVVKLV